MLLMLLQVPQLVHICCSLGGKSVYIVVHACDFLLHNYRFRTHQLCASTSHDMFKEYKHNHLRELAWPLIINNRDHVIG
jgi:hypothetical protein